MGSAAKRARVCGVFVASCLLVAMVGCNDESSFPTGEPGSTSSSTSASTSTSTSTSSSTNVAQSLALSGTPPTAASVGTLYSFQPVISGANGTVGYSIENVPNWATFSTVTGALQGTPSAVNVGTYRNIVIRASNGREAAALPAFSVTVAQGTAAAPNGADSATLAWSPPVTDTDGNPLTDLAGFYIYYGTDSTQLNNLINDETGGTDTGNFTVTGLAPGTYYFEVAAYSALGVQSAPSNQVSVTIT
jgi:hypothetical protein